MSCTITYTEEEKYKLSYYDDSYILFSYEWPWEWGRTDKNTIDISVPNFVNNWNGLHKCATKGLADQYERRLKNEILPRLKALTNMPERSRSTTFEL